MFSSIINSQFLDAYTCREVSQNKCHFGLFSPLHKYRVSRNTITMKNYNEESTCAKYISQFFADFDLLRSD